MKFNFILPVLICSTLLIGCKNPFEAKNKGEYMEMEIEIYLKFMADQLSDSYALSQKQKMQEKVTKYKTLKSQCLD